MNLVETLQNDLVMAMKSKDKDKLSVLRMVKGAMQLEHINNKKELTDELAVDVISKQIKTRNESIKEFEKGNRQDLIDQTKKEIALLQEYLPEQLSKEEIIEIVDQAFEKINPQGPRDMGLIMKEVTPSLKGKADMGEVSKLIKDKLEVK